VAHAPAQTVAPFPVARQGLTDAECRALVEQQPLVTYVDGVGDDVETLFISENVLGLSGYPAAWWCSPRHDFFSILHPDDVDAVRAAHVASARTAAPYKSDFRLVKPDGSIVWVQAEDRPVLGGDGRPLYRLGYLVDVTERHAAQDELRDAQRAVEEAHQEAVAALRAKSEFLATVSHEIRTPMHGVISTLDLLQRTPLDGEQSELAAIARASATALLAVINDMLDLQRTETGHTVLASVPLDVAALVAEVGDTLRATAEAKGLELVTRVADEVPGDLLGDPGRLRQILLNLLGNAVKFTPCGRVSVDVTHGAFDAGSAELILTVSDSGIGIDAETRARAFEPFVQADGSCARPHEGTGLGLAITRQLVELMGGTIELSSELGRGTTVTAVVRLRRGAGAAAPAPAPALALDLEGTVLVVEDNAVNREIATRQLERLGLAVDVVESGSAAIDALEDGRYDAVLMDMRMPGMSGIQATERIRERERETGRRRVAVIAMTANARPDDRAACLRAGMDAFATKPLTLDDLGRAVGPWLTGAGDVEATLDRMTVELGSAAPVRKIAQTWLRELPERLDDLDAAAGHRDAGRLRDGAHTLKSTCGLVGAGAAARLAGEIERRAADGDASGPERVDVLRVAAEAAAGRVRDWIHVLPPDAAA